MAVFRSMSHQQFLAIVQANGLQLNSLYYETDTGKLWISSTNVDNELSYSDVSGLALTGKLELGFDGAQGPTGPAGAAGAPGPQGPAGSGINAQEIQNVPVAGTTPTNGAILVFNSETGEYEPGDPLVQGTV